MTAPTAITQTAFQTAIRVKLRTNSTDFTTGEIDAGVDEANQIILAKIKECDYNYFSEYATQLLTAYVPEYTLATTTDKILYVETFSGTEVKPVRLDARTTASGYYFNGTKIGVKPIPTQTYIQWSDGTPTYATTATITLTGDYSRYFKSGQAVKYYTTASPTTLLENTLSTDSTFSSPTTTVTLTSSTLDSGFTNFQIQDGLLMTILPKFSTLGGTTDVPDFDSTWHFIIYDYLYYIYYLKFPTEGNAAFWQDSFYKKIDELILPNVERDDAMRKIPIKVNSSGVSATTR